MANEPARTAAASRSGANALAARPSVFGIARLIPEINEVRRFYTLNRLDRQEHVGVKHQIEEAQAQKKANFPIAFRNATQKRRCGPRWKSTKTEVRYHGYVSSPHVWRGS